jgi:hypothetical protein
MKRHCDLFADNCRSLSVTVIEWVMCSTLRVFTLRLVDNVAVGFAADVASSQNAGALQQSCRHPHAE